jgi:hypothetical protein
MTWLDELKRRARSLKAETFALALGALWAYEALRD